MAGTIEVTDWAEHHPAVRDLALAEYATAAGEHRHVHGANLSFTADAYHAAGGFPPLTFDEDVALFAAFQAHAEPITWATDLPVSTSARRRARTPHGFATYLTTLDTTRDRSTPGSAASPKHRAPLTDPSVARR